MEPKDLKVFRENNIQQIERNPCILEAFKAVSDNFILVQRFITDNKAVLVHGNSNGVFENKMYDACIKKITDMQAQHTELDISNYYKQMAEFCLFFEKILSSYSEHAPQIFSEYKQIFVGDTVNSFPEANVEYYARNVEPKILALSRT